ncbi:hypothetical protein TNCV_1379901 [Trichonephila clavipes]|nr:hypothetical protein TNCV_1379901 [Trichonephila clavipes]
MYFETFVLLLHKLQKTHEEKFKALHLEEAFNGLFDFSSASKVSSGEILLQSWKQMKVTWCEIRTVDYSLPTKSCNMVCVAVAECGLALSSNNRTPDLRSPDNFFRIAPFNFYRV